MERNQCALCEYRAKKWYLLVDAHMSNRQLSMILAFSCTGVYVLSLFLTAFVLASGEVWPGWLVLEVGWMGVLMLMFAWLANVAGLVSFLLLALCDYGLALMFTVIAFVLGLQSFFFKAVPYDNRVDYVDHLDVGFYVWMLSFFLAALCCFAQLVQAKRKTRKTSGQ